MSFGSEALFTAFDNEGWNTNKAPTIEEAYKELPQRTTKDRLNELELENENLKRICRILTPPKPIKDQDEGPLCQINFFHNQLSRYYKNELIQLITEFLITKEADRKDDLEAFPRQKSAICLPSRGEDYDEFVVMQSVHIFPDGHVLDRIGEPLDKNSNPESSKWIIPSYESLYKDMLTENIDDDTAKFDKMKSKILNICFNCGSEKCSIAACPHPKNPEEINRRKAEWLKAVGNTPKRNIPKGRLFEVGAGHTNNKKFSAFKPGVISDALKEALALKKDELPPWITSMREQGYPPGWLAMAEVRKASVSVNEEGQINEINPHLGENEDSDSEDEGKRTQLVGLDVNKIVEYPGFNMPMPKGVKDPFRPKWSKDQSKKKFIDYYLQANRCERITRKRSADLDNDDESSSKIPKLELEDEDEFEEVDELFQPGWVKKEEPEQEDGVTEKGLPTRNKWQTGVVGFAHDAYQVEPTKE